MVNKFLVLMMLCLYIQAVSAQIIFETSTVHSSDISVFVVDREYKADLLVYTVDREYKAADNRGLWYFTDANYKAEVQVFFVDRDYKADLKVFFVDRAYKAGWRNEKINNWPNLSKRK